MNSSSSTAVDRHNIGMVHGPGAPGRWDSERVSGPRVLRCADGIWRMWYYGRDPSFDRLINLPTGRIGLAESDDGIHWRSVEGPATMGAVMDPSTDLSRFDCGHIGVADVHEVDAVYYMWYFGGTQITQQIGPHQVRGFDLRPGFATSSDGLHWQRQSGPAYGGAILDLGAPGEFDALMVGWPQVVHDDRGWKLYYHTLDPMRGFLVGLAESEDGHTWYKQGMVMGPGAEGRFDEKGIATRQVLRVGGDYLMFYEGVNRSGYRSIGLARSNDGRHWHREKGPLADGSVFSHAPRGSGRWDAYAIGTPCIIEDGDGGWRMYYIGSNETGDQGIADEMALRHRIGMAIAHPSDPTRWTRYGD